MDQLVKTVKALNQNFIFRYLSSVKLAIPLMLVLGVVVGWGTVIESRYNSEYSNLVIYKSLWFNILLILLWINIFCATISRIPFKRHHTGFVITHIGLLILLVGGFLTNRFGIDGQLSVLENQTTRTYVIPELMIGYQYEGQSTVQKTRFAKMLSVKEKDDLSAISDEIGHIVQVEKYIPFAKIRQTYESDASISNDVALSFILKSQFFNVNEWLNTKNNPEMQMGPATLRIKKVDSLDLSPRVMASTVSDGKKTRAVKKIKSSRTSSIGDKLIIVSLKQPSLSKEFDLAKIANHEIEFSGMKFKLTKKFKSAVVAGNKIQENQDSAQDNPAVEISVKKGDQEMRDILFGKFKDFSLNKEGIFGFRFHYLVSEATDPNTNDENSEEPLPQETAATGPQSIKPGSRVIEFRVAPDKEKSALVILYKDGQVIQSTKLLEGEKLQTPWMGIEIFLGSLKFNAIESTEVTSVSPEKRKDLPPSAILFSHGEDKKFWLAEGESKDVVINGKNVSLYFGKELLEIPFDLALLKFTKQDYPGTTTPMSYESLVKVGDMETPVKISMNEPLKKDGFTLYQASYIMNPNEPAVSILSVNKDPGRALKYLGSIILSIGIIVFTLMKSRAGRKLNRMNTL